MNLRDFKKDVEYFVGEFVDDCALFLCLNPGQDSEKIEGIVEEAVEAVEEIEDKAEEAAETVSEPAAEILAAVEEAKEEISEIAEDAETAAADPSFEEKAKALTDILGTIGEDPKDEDGAE